MRELTLDSVKKILIKLTKILIVIILIIIALFIIYRVSIYVKNALFPPIIPPPTTEFGVLPPPFFAGSINKDFTFSIDTLSGDFPVFPDRVNIYKLSVHEPDILAIQRADSRMKSLGFAIGPEELTETVYRWRSNDNLNRSLVLSLKFPEFNLSSAYLTNPTILSASNVPSEEEAITKAQALISALSLYPKDIDSTKTITKLLDIKNGVVEEASKSSDIKLVNVNFFQKDIDDIPIVYPQAGLSSMSVTVGSGDTVVDARFFYQNIGEESGEYPIKTIDTAYEELVEGNAIVIAHTGSDLDIKIKNGYLAYYVEGRQQDFLTPVYVFEGDNGFYAYVTAITDEWVDK